jgi:hypothetical protein
MFTLGRRPLPPRPTDRSRLKIRIARPGVNTKAGAATWTAQRRVAGAAGRRPTLLTVHQKMRGPISSRKVGLAPVPVTTQPIDLLDRVYLNAYVPRLQTSARVAAFLSGHLGFPSPSPTLFNQIGQRFRRAVASYAEANDVPWIKFGRDDDKLAVMRAHLDRQAATGTSRVAGIGVAQEFRPACRARKPGSAP